MRVSVIGAGSWGTALANLLVKNNHEVLVYDVDEAIIEEINITNRNLFFIFNFLFFLFGLSIAIFLIYLFLKIIKYFLY